MSKQQFGEVRHITLDPLGRIYEVVTMFDRHARRTQDPSIAVSCVLAVGGGFIEQDTDDVPIYMVH